MNDIRTNDDLMLLLDELLRDQEAFWNGFYTDREKPVPFFVNAPDESLVRYFVNGRMKPGKVLDIGCGPGRNSIYFAKQGCEVDAVDISQVSLDWARERAEEQGLNINFIHSSIFDMEIIPGSYDIVYDGGCLHHIPPHRRIMYIPLIERSLKPGGLFGITVMRGGCELGGSEMSDLEVYQGQSMKGGLAYPPERLRELFVKAFDVIELRTMKEMAPDAPVFGRDFLCVGLFKKR